jgi:protocatechuate 3,4-dioxygenase beta subunit
MDKDDAIVGHILSRRELLGLFGAAGVAAAGGVHFVSGLPNLSGANVTAEDGPGLSFVNLLNATATGLVVTPAVTEGPFFVDERLNRSDLIGRSKRKTVLGALPITLKIKVNQINGTTVTPLTGAQVDVWHADAAGVYSDEPSQQLQSEDTTGLYFLRGYQVTNTNGVARFNTVYPGWYDGRTTHIHFKIRLFDSGGNTTYEFTSQLFFNQKISTNVYANSPYTKQGTSAVRNGTDTVFNETDSDGDKVGPQLLLTLTPNATGYFASFVVTLDMTSVNSSSQATSSGASGLSA